MPVPPPDEHALDNSANLDVKQHDMRGSPSENRVSLQVESGVVPGHVDATPPVVHSSAACSHAQGDPEDYSCKIEEIVSDE